MEPPPPLPFAHAADLVRSHQKDEVCRGLLRQHVCEALEEVVGHRTASKFQASAAALSDLAYNVSTAVLGGCTLGEEYCELLPVVPSPDAIGGLRRPSQTQRLLAVLVASCPAVATLLDKLRAGGAFGATRRWSWLLALLAAARIVDIVPLVQRLHHGVFYLFGSFRHISDRCLGIRMLSLSERPYRSFSYKPLGALILAQLLGELYSRYAQWRRRRNEAAAEAEAARVAMAKVATDRAGGLAGHAADDRQPICRICMCPADCATATPCGHLFCWECIASWCALKASCPLCRTSAPPQRLLPLRHYEVAPAGSAR